LLLYVSQKSHICLKYTNNNDNNTHHATALVSLLSFTPLQFLCPSFLLLLFVQNYRNDIWLVCDKAMFVTSRENQSSISRIEAGDTLLIIWGRRTVCSWRCVQECEFVCIIVIVPSFVTTETEYSYVTYTRASLAEDKASPSHVFWCCTFWHTLHFLTTWHELRAY